jgi:3-phenylpropionate/trans-cinnamate dioxygenase ferredoxin subunit
MENGQLECVYHGARFDVRTGKPTRLPAVRPVRTFPVEIRDGGVFVRID